MNGRGLPTDPYLIHSIADLEILRDRVNNGDIEDKIYVKLDADIMFSDRNWTPIGTDQYPFVGNFDAQGHTITYLRIDQAKKDYIGFFGVIENSEIRNLGIIESYIQGRQYVGGLVGKMNVNSTIEKCYLSSGTIGAGGNYLGGIVGYSDYYNRISNCYSTLDLIGSGKNIGGIVGYSNYKCIVKNCYTQGAMQTTGDCIGGIVGYNGAGSEIKSCYSTCLIKGSNFVGGIVGRCEQNEKIGVIENCIALSEMLQGHSVGRIIGEYIEACSNNYAFKGLRINDELITEGELDNKDGEDIAVEQIYNEVVYLTKDFNYTNGWILRKGKLPILKFVKGQGGQIPSYLALAKPIPFVQIDLTPPQINQYPQKEIGLNNEHYEVKEILWEPDHTYFQPNVVYQANFLVEAQNGFSFEDVRIIQKNSEIKVVGPNKLSGSRMRITYVYPKTQLPMQKGNPVFIKGSPPILGQAIKVGVGNLEIHSSLEYTWYRTKENQYNMTKEQLLSHSDTYTPEQEDIGMYLLVIAKTPDAEGLAYVLTDAPVKKAPYTGEVREPLMERLSTNSITLKSVDHYEYGISLKGQGAPSIFTMENTFNELLPNTLYHFYQRVMASEQYEASQPKRLSITTAKILIHTLVSAPTLSEHAVVDGEPIKAPQTLPIKTNIEGIEIIPDWYAYDDDNQPIPLDGTRLGNVDDIYLFKAILTVPSSDYSFDTEFNKRVGIVVSNDGMTLTYTFKIINVPKTKKELIKTSNHIVNAEPKRDRSIPVKDNEDGVNQQKLEADTRLQHIKTNSSEYAKRYNDIELTEKMSANHMGVWNLHIRS